MSHFAGLVVLTQKYLKEHDSEESLEKYSENLEVPEYKDGDVTDFDKIQFLEYYNKDEKRDEELMNALYKKLYKEEKKDQELYNRSFKAFIARLRYDNKEDYAEIFKEKYVELFNNFEEEYAKRGNDWNGNEWRKNKETGEYERFSTYNPESKWDWYEVGGRWDESIKTNDGKYVNECLLGDIDWQDFKPEDYEEKEETTIFGKKYHPLKEDLHWHFTRSDAPFALIVDGEWKEKGQMGWFGISINEKEEEDWNKEFFDIIDNLPQDSEVTLIDFHI